jgi:hypothetical protein
MKFRFLPIFGLLLVTFAAHAQIWQCGWRPFIYADYLYWQPLEDQLAFGQILPGITPDQIPSVTLPGFAQPLNQKFRWGSGVRVGVGAGLPCCDGDAILEWTHFNHRSTTSRSFPNGTVLPTATLGAVFPAAAGNAASSAFRIQFDTLDFILGGRLRFGNCFVLRPNLGIKAAWINQRQVITFNDFTSGISTVNLQAIRTNNIQAVGPRVGFDHRWYFYDYLGLFASASTAFLYSAFRVNNQFTVSPPGLIPFPTSVFRANKSRVRPTTQLLIGVEWTALQCRCFDFWISAAYEVQYWWNQWQAVASSSQPELGIMESQGDLVLHGLTVRFGVTM